MELPLSPSGCGRAAYRWHPTPTAHQTQQDRQQPNHDERRVGELDDYDHIGGKTIESRNTGLIH